MPGAVPEHFRTFAESRYGCFDIEGKSCFSPDKIDVSQKIVGRNQIIDVGTQVFGKPTEDPGDLPFLFQFQFPDFIVSFDDLGRFDIRGFTRSRFVVDDTVYFSFIGRRHGDDHTTVPDSDGSVFFCPPFCLSLL